MQGNLRIVGQLHLLVRGAVGLFGRCLLLGEVLQESSRIVLLNLLEKVLRWHPQAPPLPIQAVHASTRWSRILARSYPYNLRCGVVGRIEGPMRFERSVCIVDRSGHVDT